MSKLIEGFKVDKSEYSKIYDSKDYLLVVPHTHTASCKYGANTKWCTTKRDDDTDFDEHTTMGVLAYLIVKNPEISKHMSSEKFGLYRGNGYDLMDLIVYDELNNEHLKGRYYLSNEFEKADKDSDFWKIMNAYDEYYKSMDLSNLIGGKPGKLNENITVDMIKDLCNRMIVSKKGSFGVLPKTNVVFYTKGGKIVDIEKTKGDLNIPFKMGDNIHELIKWVDENDMETNTIPRRRRIGEQEGEEEITSKTDPKIIEDPNLFNICVGILSGTIDEDDVDDIVSIHNNKYDSHLKDIIINGKRGGLEYRFEDQSDFCEYFSGNSDSHYVFYTLSGPDYEYYSDSVYQDTTDENYHWTQLKKDQQIKLAEALIDVGFELEHYNEEKKSKILNNQYGWGDDELSWELREIFEYHFPSYNEKLSDEYQEAATSSYAEGFYEEFKSDWNKWIENAEYLGITEADEFEEYEVDVARIFTHLIRISSSRGSLQDLVERNARISSMIGSGADVFSMDEARYEYQKDEPFEKLQEWIETFVNEFISEELDDNPLIPQMIREHKIAESLGLKPMNMLLHKDLSIIDNNWTYKTIDDKILALEKRGKFPKENVINVNGGDKKALYIGYNINDEGHVLYVEQEIDENRWHSIPLKKMVVDIKDLANIVKQTKLDLSEIIDLNEGLIKEQNQEIMSTYYAMMSKLQDYYGEDNVDLIGEPAKIYIFKNNIVRWDGTDLFIKLKGGTEQRIKVTEFKSSGSNFNGATYPSIQYITNRIPKSGTQTKDKPKEKKKSTITSKFFDGTTMKASQRFWDEIKVDEGALGGEGKPVLKAYKLGDGRITIGWGHTGSLTDPKPRVGDVITRRQAQVYLQNDATESANCVRRMLGEWKSDGLKTYMVTQNMFDVLVSLVFNAGCQGLRSSKFIQLVKKGEYEKAAKLLPTDTTMINGKFSKGLTARRQKEAKRFLE